MRKIRYNNFFIFGFLLFFAMEMGVLVFAEKVYFSGGGRYFSKLVDMDRGVKPKSGIALEPNTVDPKLSYNGIYMAFMEEGNLYSLNLEKGKKDPIQPEEGYQIAFYQWIYDRNRLVVAERKENPKPSSPFRLYYYDTASFSKEEIYNGVGDKVLTLPGHSKDERITAIDLSTLTNMMYFKLTQNPEKSRIYQVNIMAQYERTDTATTKIGAMAAIKSTDDFFYENVGSQSVHEENRGQIQVDGKTRFKLIGIDEMDRVYLGQIQDQSGEITTIDILKAGEKKGRKRPKNEKIQSIQLPKSTKQENIHLSLAGQLWINDESKKEINFIASNLQDNKGIPEKKSISYQGDQLFYYNKGFLTVDHQGQIRNYPTKK